MNHSPTAIASLAALLATVSPAMADIITIDVQAYIDGRDLLSIDGNTLQWRHLDYAAVGRYGGGNGNEPTIISTTLDGSPILTNYNWYPDWPEPPPAEIRYPAVSSIFLGLTPSLPSSVYGVSLEVVSATNSLSIYSLPSAANNYALTLDFNDDPHGGAAWYEAKVTIDTSVVPELSTWVMMALGFMALGFRRYRVSREPRSRNGPPCSEQLQDAVHLGRRPLVNDCNRPVPVSPVRLAL